MTEDEMYEQSVHGQLQAARVEIARLKRELAEEKARRRTFVAHGGTQGGGKAAALESYRLPPQPEGPYQRLAREKAEELARMRCPHCGGPVVIALAPPDQVVFQGDLYTVICKAGCSSK